MAARRELIEPQKGDKRYVWRPPSHVSCVPLTVQAPGGFNPLALGT